MEAAKRQILADEPPNAFGDDGASGARKREKPLYGRYIGGSWGHSSAGRAPALQAGGHRFDPGWLHHRKQGRTGPVPQGAGPSASPGPVDRVRRLIEALTAVLILWGA